MNYRITSILKKIKPFTLIIAVSTGLIVFLLFHYIKAISFLKPAAYFVSDSLNIILFFILFFAFCKIEFKQMRLRAWHIILALTQFLSTALLALLLYIDPDSEYKVMIEGALICFITPTAASASVITGKLGGNESSLTTYIIISNFVAAFTIPLVFPLFCNTEQQSFIQSFFLMLSKVSPVLIFPLILAVLIRRFTPSFHAVILSHTKDVGFYLWAFIITVVSSRTFANIFNSDESGSLLIGMAFLGLLLTILSFSLGKITGHFYGQRISAGQGLGQKNMVFGIWVTLLYLSSTVAIIPGTYIIWQNLVNATQMYIREKNLARWQKEHKPAYQE